MVLNLIQVVPIKTRFAHGKRHPAIHKCLALISMSKTTSLFNPKPPANDSNPIRNSTCLKLSPFELKL